MLGSVRVGYNIRQSWQQVENGHTLCKLGEEEGNQVCCRVRLNTSGSTHMLHRMCTHASTHTFSHYVPGKMA